MKAAIFIKINPGKTSSEGDIVDILPIDITSINSLKNYNRIFDKHLLIVADLMIPCGEKFNNWDIQCHKCLVKNMCDRIKYMGAIFDDATLKVTSKYKCKIDYKTFISADSLTLIDVEKKTAEDRAKLVALAFNNPKDTSFIMDKATTTKIDTISAEKG